MTAPEQDIPVVIVWNALCPVGWAGCDWRSDNHASEERALAASRAHGDTDTPRHRWLREHHPRSVTTQVASIDFLPPVGVSRWADEKQ